MSEVATLFDLPDATERRSIETELDTTMLVEAAAGTGKTTSLMKRMVALLAAGLCPIDKMAAVTFTRKATAELRARFQVELERQAEQAAGTEKSRLQAALGRIEQCFIGTIHSFCGRLLRERPIEAGVDVAFEELDEDADYRLRRAAWDQYVAELHAGSDPILRQLEDLGLELGDLEEQCVEYADFPDVGEWPAALCRVDAQLAEDARQALREYAAHMSQVAPTLPRHAGNDQLIALFQELPRRLRHTRLGHLRELMPIVDELHSCKVVLKEWPEGKDQGRRERDRLATFVQTFADPLLEQWRCTRYAPVINVFRGAVKVYDRMRAERGALSYQDLLMKAADLLRDQPHIRTYFRGRFTHLLVDEFQDTDPIQAEVMLLLTADDPHLQDWTECRPVAGSLFVVGDPKQSIYRFRRADIVTYNEVRRIIAACGRVVPLTANFRSLAPLIEWINRISGDLFPAANDYCPEDHKMSPARGGSAQGDCAGVWRLDVPHSRKNDALAYEADAIARIIRDALDRGLTVPRTPKQREEGVPDHVVPGDFLVLTWWRPALVDLAEELQAYGIPVDVTGSAAVNEIDDVALLHTALAAVVEADNPVALVGALRSELFGISDTDLYRFAKAGGRFNYYDEERAQGIKGAAPIAEAFARLRECADWLRQMQPVAAVERIAGHLGLYARATSGHGGGGRAGGLCKAIELLRSAYREQWSAAALVEYLWQLLDPAIWPRERHDGVPVRPHDGKAVRVMNLHQAKGLEAPIVFLADGCGSTGRSPDRHIDRRQGAVRGFLQVRKRGDYGSGPVLAHPEDWARHEREEQCFLDAERDRLFYVAATRAGAQLIVSRPAKSCRWAKIADAIADAAALGKLPAVTPRRLKAEALPLDSAEVFESQQRERWERRAEPTYDVKRAKALAVSGGTPGQRAHPGEHGTEWGVVIHVLLEAAMERRDSDLLPLAAAALREQELDPRRAGEAVELVEAVMESALWKRAATAQKRMAEVPIQWLEHPEGDGVET
ncbi:MAG: UvrD-helicase domain-containing protein, partial [Planctomycetota bacterium]